MMGDDDTEVGCFFPLFGFSQSTHEVLIDGLKRTDYRLFVERGTGELMIYFERLTYHERCHFQIAHKPPMASQ